MLRRRHIRAAALALVLAALTVSVQLRLSAQTRQAREPEWSRLETETLEHFQSILRLDTSNPPGNETAVVEYLSAVLTREGIPFQTFALDSKRANLVADRKSVV